MAEANIPDLVRPELSRHSDPPRCRERGSEDCTASQRIQQKEEEFKKFEAEHSSGYKKAEEDANKEAEVKLQDIQTAGKEKGNKVVEDLINAVIDVNPQASDKIKA
ncbi:uncharacterized protein AFUA_7G02020 [Aspergillus fumigatus Af293]|uniref:V-type proton ATPase subunit G n=1 Tax=Aspergillus fumigatus (strain ATCC MYA-4609 / CBS 101355 / FGSC A1100 / Af293) TaxID=330879 RepID=Q4WAP5_ASPFU|nr:conserved hypothetical protein [Aspergillus fumigatus Af293]EAL84691.2 conserved hypothetical protein [Aspergillus fumigatus Af293]KEY82752.1 hypothetical protein BA78_8601 [Aspergillus fumigatus]